MYNFFRSVRVAVGAILLLTALSLLSTLIPQGREAPWYQEHYGPLLGPVITALDFDHYFSSVLFVAPAAVLAVSLCVCTVDRTARRFRTKAQKRFGPDIVHVALLVLIAGAIATGLGRHERIFFLSQGEQLEVTSHYSIKLLSFEYLRYENGMPKAWISTVDVLRDGVPEIAAFPIRVNHPLRLGGVSIYQASWDNQSTFLFRDASGGQTSARIGDAFRDGDTLWYLVDVVGEGTTTAALLQQYRGTAMVSERKLAVMESLGHYTLVDITPRMATGLQAVNDPGFPVVIIGVALLAVGLALTLVQSRADAARESSPES
ncbi:MAG TPA: cytochrome c biogenesis protein ResB [Spirochaetia bacterium]|nr:cytochrome c biogenesis protein ResB [Spirochaetia bacterium]